MPNPVRAANRRRLSDRLAQELIAAIVSGDYPPRSLLPTETQLAGMTGVSRLTVREAVKSLQDRGVVRVEQGRGTFVNPPSEWSPFDPMLLAVRSADQPAFLSEKLLEARRVVEVGVCELAATRRSAQDLAALEAANAAIEEAEGQNDVDHFVEGDIAFHQAIMDAAGNAFLAALFEPIRELLYQARRQTSSFPEARKHALAAHRRILRALRSRSTRAARDAMHDHLIETEKDLVTYSGGHPPIRTRTGEAE
jgi:GntR family transcriptional regulator, transcriptional repressor for pyruvate dehydrogenase complex